MSYIKTQNSYNNYIVCLHFKHNKHLNMKEYGRRLVMINKTTKVRMRKYMNDVALYKKFTIVQVEISKNYF